MVTIRIHIKCINIYSFPYDLKKEYTKVVKIYIMVLNIHYF